MWRKEHLWIFFLQTRGQKWTFLLPFMTSIHSFQNISVVSRHTGCFSNQQWSYWESLRQVSSLCIPRPTRCLSRWMLTTPWCLAVLQAASDLWGQLPPPSFSHGEPRPSSANHHVYPTHPFEKLAAARNAVCSIPLLPTFWHTERTDARRTRSTCGSQPSREGNQTAAEGPFVLLGVRRRGSLLPTSKKPVTVISKHSSAQSGHAHYSGFFSHSFCTQLCGQQSLNFSASMASS